MPNFSTLASIESITDAVIPFIAVLMAFVIPIVAILTGHQRKMAELMRQDHMAGSPQLAGELEALKFEVAKLRELVHEQAIMIDDRRGLAIAPPPAPAVQTETRLT